LKQTVLYNALTEIFIALNQISMSCSCYLLLLPQMAIKPSYWYVCAGKVHEISWPLWWMDLAKQAWWLVLVYWGPGYPASFCQSETFKQKENCVYFYWCVVIVHVTVFS